MAAPSRIEVEGLAKLERALGRLHKDAKKELNKRLRVIGDIVAAEAHNFIRSKGLTGGPRSTGQLDRLTRTTVSGTGTVFVRSGAVRKTGRGAPYNYPRVWEFSRAGQRAFLYPALERARPAAQVALVELVSGLERIFAE